MKKNFLLMALMLLCSAFWSSARCDDALNWTYDPEEPLITDAAQMSDNCEWSASAGPANLIDGNTATHFHSDPTGMDLRKQDEWIEFDLPYAVQHIYFKMVRRLDGSGTYQNAWNQLPNNVDILVTDNDSTWTKVTNVSRPDMDNTSHENFDGYIDLGKDYLKLRFLIKGTVDNNSFFNIEAMQIYRTVKASEQAKLNVLLNNLKNSTTTFTTGKDPGYYGETEYEAMTQAFDNAAVYVMEQHTDDEYKAMGQTIQDAYDACVASKKKVTDGYYYIKSAYTAFKDVQPDVTKAMCVNSNNNLAWGDLDENVPTYVFHIVNLEGGHYSIQSIQNKLYVNNAGGAVETASTTPVSMTEEQEKGQDLIELGYGEFKVCNELNVYSYNASGSNNGNGKSGDICTQNSALNGESAWYLTEITDQAKIDELISAGDKYYIADKLLNAVNAAEVARQKTNDYAKLITDGKQISSNAQSAGDGSSYANLIDGNTESIFHSVWTAAFKTAITDTTLMYGWHNLQFVLPEAVSKIRFNFTGRNSDTWADTPNHITIYGTNDDALGARTASADSTLWTEITDLTKGFPSRGSLKTYSSPTIDLNGSYKYLRFAVKGTNNQNIPSERTFLNPFVSGVTFNLSEIQIYDGNPAASSEYNTVAGMKEACDALDAPIADARQKIANLTVTQADIDALNSLTDVVNKLYVDRDALDSELSGLIDSANTLYNTIIPTKYEKLITSASQLSTNSSSNNDGSSFANLIDGNLTTNFHSHWDTAMASDAVTDESWTANQEAWVKSNANNIAVGIGYHNLQVKLNEPASKFYFHYVGRGNTDWHDNPNHIKIFATNDDALGASTDAAESASWTEIKEMVMDTVQDVRGAEYTSPFIELGANYKYIRFVMMGTTHMGKVDSRMFAKPEITGITWNVEEWQMYNDANQNKFQYNYVPGMKEAADAMKALVDARTPIVPHSFITYEPISTLRAAYEKVSSLYADTTELASLYKNYIQKADSSVVAEGIGFVDAQGSIDAFRSAVNTAKSTIDKIQPSVASINTAIADMNKSYTAFLTHVTNITPNQWYNIVSGSTRAVFTNQPIFLNSTSTGYNLKIGEYPIETNDPKGDPYAIFRFVPVEGQEGQYNIQSLGTGQYFGAFRGDGADLAPLMSHEKAAYKLMYFGNGKFKMIQADVKNEMDALKTDNSKKVVLNYPENGDNQQTWKFNAVNSDQELRFSYMADNNICVMTLPFAAKGDLSIMALNDGVANTYAIQSMNVTEEGTVLNLKIQEDIEAGVPFILTTNDYTLYDATAPKCPISVAVPESVVDTSSIVANGLVGTLQGMKFTKQGMGIFSKAVLVPTTDEQTTIAGRSGYINPTMVTNEEGTPNLTITIGDIINSAKPGAVVTSAEKANLYTSDGVLLKKDVKATQVPNNLQKGIYILGKKKITVK